MFKPTRKELNVAKSQAVGAEFYGWKSQQHLKARRHAISEDYAAYADQCSRHAFALSQRIAARSKGVQSE